MRKILITGGAGYVGGAITDLLAQNSDYQIRVYDSLLYEDTFRKPVEFVHGDVLDIEKLKPHLDWADTVVWLAALVGDGACQINPDITVKLNQEAVKTLADNFDGRIIFMSTCSVYGAQNSMLDESSGTSPLSLYAATKLKAEDYLKDKNAIIFRLGTLFGVGDCYSRIRMDLVVNILTAKAIEHGKINVFGGDQFRPLLHVKDVARAVAQNIDSPHVGIFNLMQENKRIIDLACDVQSHFDTCTIVTTDVPFQDTRNYRVSCEKAKSCFGFSPIYDVNYGVKELKSLIMAGRIKNLDDERYSNARYLQERLY
ncbi:MAG: SDR family oxidoreductase [Bacteriovoracaceae bacterium]|jgi:nucleoside-diphosphate-sugar epimerase|nr:SDR family oxidoreductase [Bacteriovoracaceae bacterium]